MARKRRRRRRQNVELGLLYIQQQHIIVYKNEQWRFVVEHSCWGDAIFRLFFVRPQKKHASGDLLMRSSNVQ